ncbi:MAG TPA: type VI secretion system tube protein TssD [Symbiobacteriaceae bacterium]|nr:type VI secretion system tube protein TssD [Symbiobacteriaceae bacterium]
MRRGFLVLAVLALTVMLGIAPAFAAETVHLYLKVSGQEIQGESTQQSLGRAGSIECVMFEQAIQAAEKEREYTPVRCVKRVDKSTPLLIKALVEGRPVEATFKFFRLSPTGDGTTEQFYTIELREARVTSYRMWVPNALVPASASDPPLEEITFAFRAIAWTYTVGGVTYSDGGTVTTRQLVPPAPGLKAVVSGRTVELSWSAVTPPAGKTLQGYNIYRSTDTRELFLAQNRLNDFLVTKTSISDTVPAGTYYYGVQAVWSDQTTTQYEPPAKAQVQ